MERCFIAAKESEYYKDLMEYHDNLQKEKKFVRAFLDEKGIESHFYKMGGDGFVNQPFDDYYKSNITLKIQPTANDDEAEFSKSLLKADSRGMCAFRKNSAIGKEFAQRCIDNKIIINLWAPRLDDSFNSIRFRGYALNQFYYNDTFYIKIVSEYLSDEELPTGFVEIKGSEFYKAKEEHEDKKENE